MLCNKLCPHCNADAIVDFCGAYCPVCGWCDDDYDWESNHSEEVF